LKLAFTVLAIGVSSQVALADDVAPPPPPAISAWTAIDTRPLVVPAGKVEVHAGLPILSISDGMGNTATGEALSLGATFGAVENLELGIDYAFPLHPNGDIGSGILQLHGAFAALHSAKLDFAIAGELELNVNGDTEYQLDVAAWLRYHLTPQLSLFTGQPATPTTISGFSSFLAPPIAYQVSFGLNNNQPTYVTFPIGLGIQATPQVYLFAETSIAELFLSNGPGGNDSSVIFADAIPLGVGAFFSPTDQVDVGVVFSDDLKNAGDFYVITFAGRFYIK
jgi:hypothetical protein